MEFSASMGQWFVTFFAVWLAYWTYKSDKEESQKRKEKKEHEKALLEDVMFLTTTRVKFERHLWSILDKVASYKIQRVIITDEKEIPQSVLLPYAEYKSLVDFKQLHEYNAEEKIKERLLWQEQALQASKDKEYIKELSELD